jgi:16S rRNA (cytosine1402-N4)-methyltransferase
MVLLARNEEPLVAEPVAHRSVLLHETVELLAPQPGDVVVDATLGAGGHAERLLEAIGPDGLLIGIDRDPTALEIAGKRLARFGESFKAVHGRHEELVEILDGLGIDSAMRLLFDLGLSSMQLDDPERGFSFRADGPLDMRMDSTRGATAAELLATLSEAELREILWNYGEERQARAIAREIVRARDKQPLTRTMELVALVEKVLGPAARRFKIHPCTRTFQGIRIAVNREIEQLRELIEAAALRLTPGGRLAAISFHSLEDRAVKHGLRALEERCTCPPRLPVCACGREPLMRVLTRRAIRPSEIETAGNPRARSAKLRGGERL